MKLKHLALMASALALAAAHAESCTFTLGTERPLGTDVESTATIAGYVTTTGTATLSGTPEAYAVDSEGNHVAASNGKPKNWWLAKSRGGVLRLTEGNPNAGLAIIFR